MNRLHGVPSRRIWLLGDSAPPDNSLVAHPLDARHPTRHSIWTPVFDSIQETVYTIGRAGRPLRVRSDSIFAINAVHDPKRRPAATVLLWDDLHADIDSFRELVERHRPALILSFGAFAFEFARRSAERREPNRFSSWTVKKLGDEFSDRIDRRETALVPLLHATIARGKWHHCHAAFGVARGTEASPRNYFQFTGSALGHRLLDHHAEEDIWFR